MKTLSCSFVIAVLFITAGCGSISGNSSFRSGYNFTSIEKVAIVSIEGAVQGDVAKDQIAELFAMEFIKKGYAVVGRSQVKALISIAKQSAKSEPNLPVAELLASKYATTVGNLLDAPAILVVTVPNLGQDVTMTAELINAKDGSTLWMGRGSGKTGKSVPDAIISAFSVPQTAGENQSGAANAAQTLTSLETNKIRRVVERICGSLPSKAEGTQKAQNINTSGW
jgi:hypothetical protein